ncbi:hypothetical protein GCM10010341_78540 [Streptomyces noursei]|nr:hypothetical protein GCM10010341_78540 [Streptomyces noursei]
MPPALFPPREAPAPRTALFLPLGGPRLPVNDIPAIAALLEHPTQAAADSSVLPDRGGM